MLCKNLKVIYFILWEFWYVFLQHLSWKQNLVSYFILRNIISKNYVTLVSEAFNIYTLIRLLGLV